MMRSTELTSWEVGAEPLPLLANGKGVTAPDDSRSRPRRLWRIGGALMLILAGGILGLYV
jgi:hypothetical protein